MMERQYNASYSGSSEQEERAERSEHSGSHRSTGYSGSVSSGSSQTSQAAYDDSEEEIDLQILIGDLWKGLFKFWWIVALLAILLADLAFMGSLLIFKPEYVAKATFTISTQMTKQTSVGEIDNYTYDYSSSTASQMAKTFPYILQSDLMQEIIAQDMGVDEVNGEITAEATDNTNLFTVMVTSDNAMDAFEILKSIIDNYHKVADYVIGDTQVNILTSPTIPEEPDNVYDYLRNTIIAFLIGILLGCGFIFIYAITKNTIRREEEMKEKLNMTCLGTVPQVMFKKRRKTINQDITIINRNSGAAFQESIRALRTRLIRRMGEKEKILVITSTLPGEGKTTVSLNLAISIAQREKSVVLVDCDLRNPSIASRLSEEKDTELFGLKEVFGGEKTLKEALQYMKEEGGFYLLAGREPMENPIAAMGSGRIKDILDRLCEQFDYVILDTPPCGIIADAAAVASYADAAVYVVKQDYAPLYRIMEGIQSLSESGVKMLGGVLNGAESGLGGYGHNYGYSGGYGHYGRYGYGKYGSYGSYGYGKRYGDD
ncbi:MAG: polysaccharide biosynthesis tyrosine autokinase [Oscillospiraceae bacterium]|jgi:capsular exopolysaccharide synthesis family protein|nr:polysaccharide biosynthesis tyrosine autokinase [Oscillospiraceae bacterium]